MSDYKICSRCKKSKPDSEYQHSRGENSKLYPSSMCKTCFNIYQTDYLHKTGKRVPMNKSKMCASYLGVYIAERILSNYFEDIIQMPYGNPNYDFICKNGYKIDVKSSCIRHRPEGNSWDFRPAKNKIADYFLCLAFDNRTNLTPLHVWLIPGNAINHLTGIAIFDTQRSLTKYNQYERPLDKVITCCNTLKNI